MNNPKLALSSIAVSSCVVAVLSLSNKAYADPPATCAPGWACLLEYTADIVLDPWGGPPQPHPDGFGEWSYGSCGYDTSSPPVCSCQGNVITRTWVFDGDPSNPNATSGYCVLGARG